MNRENGANADALQLIPRGGPALDPALGADWLSALFDGPLDPRAAPPGQRVLFAPALRLLVAVCNNPLGAMLTEHLIEVHRTLVTQRARLAETAPDGRSERSLERSIRSHARMRRELLCGLRNWARHDLPGASEHGWIGLLNAMPAMAQPPRRQPKGNFDESTS